MKQEALGVLILAQQETLYHVAKTLLKSDADCADAIQNAIVKAFSGVEKLRTDRYAKTWLIRIVINECYDLLRQRSRIVPLEDHMLEGEAEEEYSELYEAIQTLPPPIRLCVTLHYLEGYSVKETAALLDVTENVVKKRLMRAREALKFQLTSEGTGYET